MSDPAPVPTRGACLCGAVRVRARVDRAVLACHCRQCQRWTGGGPLLSVRARDLAVEGEDAVRAYRASDWGERATCGTCGSILWWKMQGRPPAYIVLGLIEDQAAFRIGEEIFVDHRPAWLAPFDGAGQSTEAEEQAKLTAYLERKDA